MTIYINGIKTEKQIKRDKVLEKTLKTVIGAAFGIIFMAFLHQPAEASEMKKDCFQWESTEQIHTIADGIFYKKYKVEKEEYKTIYILLNNDQRVDEKIALDELQRIRNEVIMKGCVV